MIKDNTFVKLDFLFSSNQEKYITFISIDTIDFLLFFSMIDFAFLLILFYTYCKYISLKIILIKNICYTKKKKKFCIVVHLMTRSNKKPTK